MTSTNEVTMTTSTEETTKEYKTLPKAHWKEFTTTGKYNPGILSIQPTVEFLGDMGFTRVAVNDKKFTKQQVAYDKEYVFEFFYKKLVLGMGFVIDGVLNDGLLELFLGELLIYSRGADDRRKAEELDDAARKLAAQFPQKTAEQWKAFLLETATETPPAEDTTAKNGKGRAKATV